MFFHWVASFGFDGADIRKENRFKKRKKKVKRRRWDEEECHIDLQMLE